jgi:hypothetical protein
MRLMVWVTEKRHLKLRLAINTKARLIVYKSNLKWKKKKNIFNGIGSLLKYLWVT